MNLLWILLFTSLCSSIKCVYIKNNGYKDITVSLSEKVLKESEFDFLKLKDILRNASDILFHATKNRSYFEDFLLVVPSTFTKVGVCDAFVKTAPRNIDIYVTDSSDVSVVTTRHSKGCGEKGEIIYLSKEWMASNTQDLALQFVQQWSTFRYGVFTENPERNGSCIVSTDSTWSPTGCYNIDLNEEVRFDNNGLPVCVLPNDFREREDLHSSIMFSSAHSPKVRNFCDGESFPHNPVAPTLHNRICSGNSVWSVIKNTEDFKYGRNLPVRNLKKPKKTRFRCFKESKTHLTIMIQNTDSEARSEIRFALLYFFKIIEPGDFTVSLATFSSKSKTDDNDFVNIALEKTDTLKSLLESRVTLTENVLDVCLTCGLQKAYKISATSQYSPRTIVLIVRESSLENTKISEALEIMQKDPNTVLHVLFLEDTPGDIIDPLLVEAMQKNRGRIFRLKNEPVFMLTELTTALLEVSKNMLHLEDKVLVETAKVWEYSFRYAAGSKGTTYSSLALLKLDPSSKNSFTVKGWLSTNKIIPSQNALIIYAEIYNRMDYDVEVKARITGPGMQIFSLELRDNGNGDPDIMKGDNIYSRYFTSFSQQGTYTVSITAEAVAPENNNVSVKENSTSTGMKISQTKVIGTFRVIEALPKEDILPPNRVGDLKIISIDSANKTVLLQWTAPGNNYDWGRAKKYAIKLSNHWMEMTDFAFNLKENILLEIGGHQPGNSGVTENLMVQCPSCNINTTYYMALQAIDNNYNQGRVSNVVQIHFNDANIPPTDEDEISPETNQISTTSSSDLTEVPTENIISNDFTTAIIENQTKDGIFIEKNIFIIVVSSLGVLILIIIILNIIICCCCYKKQHSEKPNKISKKTSLQPPYNLNIAYKHGSESSLDDEKIVSNSLSTVVSQSNVNTSSDGSDSMDKRYSYHTDRSLKSKLESRNKRSDLGFKLVQPMPAYATSSLSHFVARQRDDDVAPQQNLNTVELAKSDSDDTHIYPLANEYRMYFTEDWRNLEEDMFNKVLPTIFNTSEMKPRISGNEEVELLQLPKISSKIYFIALKAIDKNGNEGKISNIVQVVINNLLINNLTQYNETENITGTVTNYHKDDAKINNTNIHIILGTVSGIIFLIIIINILIWIFCFRKYKKRHHATKIKNAYNDKRGNDINSDESILQSETENSQLKELADSQETINKITDTSNPMVMYAEVQKQNTKRESINMTYTNENFKTKQRSHHKENDLGFV